MTDIFFATQNKGKQREIKALLADVSEITPRFIDDFADLLTFDPEETGETLPENAELKARAYAAKAGMATVAEDSGFEVSALDGKPGVHSKRFFPGSDQDRCQEIIRLLTDASDRSAQFRSVFCYYDPAVGEPHFFEGHVTGQVATRLAGENGFGFDPIFMPEGYQQTFAELGDEVKNTMSHRSRAMAKVKQFLKDTYGS